MSKNFANMPRVKAASVRSLCRVPALTSASSVFQTFVTCVCQVKASSGRRVCAL